MKDRWVLAVAPLALLAFGFVLFRGSEHDIAAGANDFLAFYAGGRLAGTPDLYNPDRLRARFKSSPRAAPEKRYCSSARPFWRRSCGLSPNSPTGRRTWFGRRYRWPPWPAS